MDEETTTIAVKKTTLWLLRELKQEWKTPSFDDTIQKMIAKTKKPKKSFFGAFPELPSFRREELDRFT